MLSLVLFVLVMALSVALLLLLNRTKSLRANNQVLQENFDHSRAKLAEYESKTDDLNYELTQLRVQTGGLRTELNKFKKYQDICDIEQYVVSRQLQADNFVEVTKLNASIMMDDIKGHIERIKSYLNQYQSQAFIEIDEQARTKLQSYYKQAEEQHRLQDVVAALEHKVHGYPSVLNFSACRLVDQLIENYSEHDAAARLVQIRTRIQSAKDHHQVASCNYVDDSRRNTTIELVSMAFNSKADLYLAQLEPDNLGEILQSLQDDFILINYKGEDLSQAMIQQHYLDLRLEELKFTAILKQLQNTQFNTKQEQSA